MASIIWADVTNHYSGLSAVSAGAQTDILADVNTRLAVLEFGGEEASKLKMARIYLAAHMGVQNIISVTSAGPVASETVGAISRSYAMTLSTTGVGTSSTLPGAQFSALCRTTPARAGLQV